MNNHFTTAEDAFLTGTLIGALSAGQIERIDPIMDDEGNYTSQMKIWFPVHGGYRAATLTVEGFSK